MQNLPERTEHAQKARAGFKCVEALGRIIIRDPYPPSEVGGVAQW